MTSMLDRYTRLQWSWALRMIRHWRSSRWHSDHSRSPTITLARWMDYAALVMLIWVATTMLTRSHHTRILSSQELYGTHLSRGLRMVSRHTLDSVSVTLSFIMEQLEDRVCLISRWSRTQPSESQLFSGKNKQLITWRCIMPSAKTRMAPKTIKQACAWSFRLNVILHHGKRRLLKPPKSSIHTSLLSS